MPSKDSTNLMPSLKEPNTLKIVSFIPDCLSISPKILPRSKPSKKTSSFNMPTKISLIRSSPNSSSKDSPTKLKNLLYSKSWPWSSSMSNFKPKNLSNDLSKMLSLSSPTFGPSIKETFCSKLLQLPIFTSSQLLMKTQQHPSITQ